MAEKKLEIREGEGLSKFDCMKGLYFGFDSWIFFLGLIHLFMTEYFFGLQEIHDWI